LEPKNNEIVQGSGGLHTLDVKVTVTSFFSHPLHKEKWYLYNHFGTIFTQLSLCHGSYSFFLFL